MKKVLSYLIAAFFFMSWGHGQSPQKMSYQAVIRDASSNLVRNATVGMQISILQGSSSGSAIYVETHTSTSSSAGVVSLEIGTGTIISGTFSSIDWSNGPYFVQIETDPGGGTSYSITVTSQLLSVPYALYAANSNYTETDPNFSQSVAYNIAAADTARWTNKSDFDGEYNSLNNRPNWSDSLDAHLTNISVPSTFYDSDFKIVNSSGIAGNPTTAPNTFLAGFGAGNVENGTHDYAVTFVTSSGETGAGPSSGTVNVSDQTINGQLLLTNIPVSTDGSVTARNIYRRFNGSGTYYYLTTINDNTTASFIDNIANASLGGSLPGSNSTERSIQFLASWLSGNRVYTLPDASGKLVLDEGNTSVKTIADKSMVNHGRSVINDLKNGTYTFSADGAEWGEAYVDSNGINNSVNFTNTTASFAVNNYAVFDNSQPFVIVEATTLQISDYEINNCEIKYLSQDTWRLTCTSGTDAEKRAQILKTLFFGTDGSNAAIIRNTSGVVSLRTNINADVGKIAHYAYLSHSTGESTLPNYSGIFQNTSSNFNCSSWSKLNCSDLYSGTITVRWNISGSDKNTVTADDGSAGSNEMGTDREIDEVDNPQNCYLNGTKNPNNSITMDLEALILSVGGIDWNIPSSGSFGNIDFYSDENIPAFEYIEVDDESSYIEHSIPSGIFSANISALHYTALISEWEAEAEIQLKITNDSEDSGWLEINKVSEFTSFTSEPTKLIIKLIPTADNPTLGTPAISGFYITEL